MHEAACSLQVYGEVLSDRRGVEKQSRLCTWLWYFVLSERIQHYLLCRGPMAGWLPFPLPKWEQRLVPQRVLMLGKSSKSQASPHQGIDSDQQNIWRIYTKYQYGLLVWSDHSGTACQGWRSSLLGLKL